MWPNCLENPLRILQPTVEQPEGGLHQAVVPLEDRLTKLEGKAPVGFDFGTPEAPVLAERGHHEQLVLIPCVASRLDEFKDLAAKVRHLRRRVGSHGRRNMADQGIEQCPLVADAARDRNGLAAQRRPTLHAPFVPQGPRQASQQTGSQRAVTRIQGRQRALEERYQPFVVTCAQPMEHPAISKCRLGELLGQPEALRNLRSLPEGFLRPRLVSGA